MCCAVPMCLCVCVRARARARAYVPVCVCVFIVSLYLYSPFFFLFKVFYVHRSHGLLGTGGRGDWVPMSIHLVPALRPITTEETVSHFPPRTTILRSWDPANAEQLVYSASCCFNSCAERSHKDSVREATVEK